MIFSDGIGTAALMTTELVAVPPAPLHDKAKVFGPVAAGVTVCIPDVARLPLQAPLATQLVALLEDQVKVELCPEMMVIGAAVSCTEGIGNATSISTPAKDVPPVPVQVST